MNMIVLDDFGFFYMLNILSLVASKNQGGQNYAGGAKVQEQDKFKTTYDHTIW